MRKRTGGWTIAISMATLILLCFLWIYRIWGGVDRIVILHTNDMHGFVYPARELVGNEAVDKGGFGGLFKRVSEERASAEKGGKKILLLDSGDIFVGTPEGDLTGGKLIVELMNELGYDALTLGNHDFDHGVSIIRELAKVAEFPFLSANLIYKDEKRVKRFTSPYTVFPFDGYDIVVIGLTIPDTRNIIDDWSIDFAEPEPILSSILKDLKGRENKTIPILLSHLGLEKDREIAGLFKELPLILSGHNHQGLGNGERVKGTKTIIFQTWGKNCCVDRVVLRIRKRDGRLLSIKGRLLNNAAVPIEETPLKGIIKKYSDIVEGMTGTVVGYIEDNLPLIKGSFDSSPCGSFIVDTMKEYMDADIAIHNKTGIRNDLLKGEVRMRDLYQVLPFHNHLVNIRMKGKDIRDLLEYALSDTHYACEISGAKVYFDSGKMPGERIKEVVVRGRAMSNEEFYTVVTNSYLAKGGSGFVQFTRGTILSSSEELLRDVLAQHIRGLGTVKYSFEERLIDLKKTR